MNEPVRPNPPLEMPVEVCGAVDAFGADAVEEDDWNEEFLVPLEPIHGMKNGK